MCSHRHAGGQRQRQQGRVTVGGQATEKCPSEVALSTCTLQEEQPLRPQTWRLLSWRRYLGRLRRAKRRGRMCSSKESGLGPQPMWSIGCGDRLHRFIAANSASAAVAAVGCAFQMRVVGLRNHNLISSIVILSSQHTLHWKLHAGCFSTSLLSSTLR